MENALLKERQKNMQLRLKAGTAFMAALDDPNYQPTGGKKIDEIYVPEDDIALMALIERIEASGKATLEERLLGLADINKYITMT